MAESATAKTQLREHLASLLISPIADGFWSIQASATELCSRNRTPDQVIRTFQNMLTKIPEWSDVTLRTEVERIKTVSRCGYLDDLIMGVFISYMKSFASLHYAGGDIQIDFDRPTLERFVHEVYIQSARKLWQVAYLFKTTGVTAETQARSRYEVENIINQCLEQVIRSFLPWDSITKKYFSQSQSEPQPQPEPEPEPEPEEKKSVSFGEDEEEEYEVESEDEAPPRLNITDEEVSIDVIEEKEEVDPLKELENKATESLVLNL